MSQDVRYKMQHLGDIFVDALSCVVDSAKRQAKGVVLTYDIRELKKKKRECLSKIGMRIVQMKKAGLADLRRDDKLLELITDAENIGRFIESYEEKRKETVHGCKRNTGYADGEL
jgi:ribosomal 50S subunit-associated protein YjgA (DUF615 family)